LTILARAKKKKWKRPRRCAAVLREGRVADPWIMGG
jgi:hypothetical protein